MDSATANVWYIPGVADSDKNKKMTWRFIDMGR